MYFQQISKTILVASSLSLAPWTAALAQSVPEEIVAGWVKAATGVEFLKVSHGGISHDASSNVTTITDLTIKANIDGVKSKVSSGNTTVKSEGSLEYTISFPTIEFTNLALDNGYYSAKTIKAEVAKLDFDIITEDPAASSYATGTYDNFLINNMKWASLPEVVDDPEKPISKYYPIVKALTDISFDDAFLGGMTMSQTMGVDASIKMNLSYGSTKVGKTISGNFSNMLMSGMKMSIRAAGEASPETTKAVNSDVTFGDISVSDYNYGTLVRNFEPGKTSAGDAPYDTVFGDMIMRDMRISNAGGNFSLDQVAMRDFGARPPQISVLEEADKLFLAQQAAGEEPDPKKLIELIGRIYGAFRLGDFEFAGLKFDAPGAAKGKMDIYRVHDLSANGLGEFLLKGVNFTGGGNYFNLDLFSIADIKFPALEALINLEEAGKTNDIPAIMKAIPTLGRYQTSGLEVRVPGKGEVSLKDSKIEMAEFIGPIPTKLDVVVTDLKMPVSMMEGQAKQVLSAMGFKDILVSYGLKAVWEEASKVLSMNTSANLKDGGDINVDVSIGGVPRSMFENPTTAQQVVALLTVNSANVSFDDKSIVDKGMGIVAAQQGVDVATLKAQAVGMLPFVLQVLNKPQFVSELSDAIKTFLDTGGTIVASATPSAPVSIIQLIGVGASAPGAVIDLLNVKVSAE